MNKPLCTTAICGLLLLPSAARAVDTAASADDICLPAEDPCVIDGIWDVTGPLDFGGRTVSITLTGRLRGVPSVSLSAGAIQIASGPGENAIDADGASAGDISLRAYRSCSGDLSLLCRYDSQCASEGKGTCTAGNTGTIYVDSGLSTAGSSPGSILISSPGDITLTRRVTATATLAGSSGSEINIGTGGSLFASGELAAASAGGEFDYETGYGGAVTIGAAVDANIAGGIRVWGAGEGGQVDVSAGRDVVITSNITGNAGKALYAGGGQVDVAAGRDLKVTSPIGETFPQQINTDGGGSFYSYGYGYGGGLASGYGGYQSFEAGNDLTIGKTATVHSNGGPAASGGELWFISDGNLAIDGTIQAKGTPPAFGSDTGAAGGRVYLFADDDVSVGRTGVIDTASPLGQGTVSIYSGGKVTVDGSVDVHGFASESYYGGVATGGYFTAGGDTDVTISGKVRGGGNNGSGDFEFDVCRLHLTSTALVRNSIDTPNDSPGNVIVSVGESMVADKGSRIITDPTGGNTIINTRDPKKPAVLNGSITPAPLLNVNPTLEGCPVCGNSEIDEGESCDDGNTASGDGCRSDCQDEGCVAATPGFPSTPICDDGVACTKDDCNPVAHACQHVASCDDGIACTLDSCSANVCVHAVNDTLCNDRNDCTDDICNEATGCVYADLSGNACEDGDLCTLAGTCENGNCTSTGGLRTTRNSLKTKVLDGAANDRLKGRAEIALDQFTADPSVSGATLTLTNALDSAIYTLAMPAGQWIHSDATLWQWHSAGVDGSSVTVRTDAAHGIARVTLKIAGAEIAGAVGQTQMSLSMLFGSDPGTDQCVTARSVPCRAKGTTTICKDVAQ